MIKWHMTHDTWGVPGGLGWGLPVRWGSAAALIALSAKVQSLLQPAPPTAAAAASSSNTSRSGGITVSDGSSTGGSKSKKGKKGSSMDSGNNGSSNNSSSSNNNLLLGQFPVLALHDPKDEITQVRCETLPRAKSMPMRHAPWIPSHYRKLECYEEKLAWLSRFKLELMINIINIIHASGPDCCIALLLVPFPPHPCTYATVCWVSALGGSLRAPRSFGANARRPPRPLCQPASCCGERNPRLCVHFNDHAYLLCIFFKISWKVDIAAAIARKHPSGLGFSYSSFFFGFCRGRPPSKGSSKQRKFNDVSTVCKNNGGTYFYVERLRYKRWQILTHYTPRAVSL